jgi:heptaprenyl diphosphate synthase/octaprenyl-diphosphate synthase
VTDDLFSRLGIATEMAKLERYIGGLVTSPVLVLSQPARHILTAGGKRLRAALAFLAARPTGGSIPETAIYAAAAVELIHAASLVHDDLIDQSPHRRGRPTIHEKWHHDIALLSGDYLFALAARAITLTGSVDVMDHISAAAAAVCEGEVTNVDEIEPLEEALESYRFKIGHKTAALFEAAGKVGAACGGADAETVAAIGRFGHSLGMAFQIVDDVLDYVGDEGTMGKPAGGDLRRGLVTLPLIYALAYDDADGFLRRTVNRFGDTLTPEEFAQALRQVKDSSGPGRARQDAEYYRNEGLQYLALVPADKDRDSLTEIARLVVERRS